jgi:transposase InsO family protein
MKRKKKDQRSGPVGSVHRVKRKRNGGRGYPHGFRLKAVRLRLEEGYSLKLIAQEMGCTPNSISRWVDCYERYGEAGLRERELPERSRKKPRRRNRAVRAKIRELKREDPSRGVRRISDLLRRMFLLKAAPSTVHAELKEAGLMESPKRKPQRNPGKPRFFERSTPNQLWQSDIMSFRLKGKAVYLIGYIDDYSRYIVGLGLYRSQTGEAVLETYRRAVGDYGCPKEMLTDNGRQYATWRGKTKFQRELEKDKIHHLRSQPHHPMTLGKIERFWKSILEEFLNRARFEDFEEARERIALWVKYYNYRRPHQGIGGLCPADRYFEINHDLKATLEAGIEENVLETALRGKPSKPFYMVGKMGGQSVVIRAEKGKVRLLVDGQEQEASQELTYQIERTLHDNDSNGKETGESTAHLQLGGEDPGGTGGVDREPQARADCPGAGNHHDASGPLAEAGDEGDFNGNGAAGGGSGQGGDALPSGGAHDQPPGQETAGLEACQTPGKRAGCGTQIPGGEEEGRHGESAPATGKQGGVDEQGSGAQAAQASGADPEGAERPDGGHGSGQAPGRVAENLLQVGEAGPCGPDGGGGRPRGWAPFEPGARGGGGAEEKAGAPPAGEQAPGDAPGHPPDDERGGPFGAIEEKQGTEEQ